MSVEDQLNFQEKLPWGSENCPQFWRTVGFLSREIRKDKEEGANSLCGSSEMQLLLII